MRLFIFDLARAMAKHLRPTVKLTKEGRKGFLDKKRKGTLVSVTSTGSLRVRLFGTKTTLTFPAAYWEFDPKQESDSPRPSPAARAMKKYAAAKAAPSLKASAKKFIKQGIDDRKFLAKITRKTPTQDEYRVVRKTAKKRRSKK